MMWIRFSHDADQVSHDVVQVSYDVDLVFI